MVELARGNPTLTARLRLWTLLYYENKAIVEMQNLKQKIIGIIGFDTMKKKKQKWKVSASMYVVVAEDSISLGIKHRNTNFIASILDHY